MKRLAAMFWLLAAPGSVSAQNVAAPPLSPDTLERALGRIEWDAARRGVLLVVNAQETRPAPQAALMEPVSDADVSTLRLLAPRYGRQMFSARSVTALAPATMIALNANPGRADPFTGLQRNEQVRLLMGSLTPEQWRLIGGEQGLGAGDLTDKQRPLLLSLLPAPFVIGSYKMQGGAAILQRGKNVTLAPEQRASVRLRLARTAEFYLPHGETQYVGSSDLYTFPLPDGTERHMLPFEFPLANSKAFGITLRAEVPNRLKPGNVVFNAPAWDAPVPLANIHTVGELCERIGQRTGRELYADGRAARLPVTLRGDRARAGDLLQALCLCVTGTLRQVGPAFVLTDDLEGIATRRAHLEAWAQDADAQRQAAITQAEKAAARLNPMQYIHFDSEDPFALTDADLQKLTAGGLGDGSVPLSALPLPQQAFLKAYEAREQNPTTRSNLKVYVQETFSYVVPGIGKVFGESASLAGVGVPRPPLPASASSDTPAALPPGMTPRALIVAPSLQPASADTLERATLIAASARRHGLNQLWVKVAEGKAEQKTLANYIAAGKKNGLAVVAVLRLMRRNRDDKQPNALSGDIWDRNLSGESVSASATRNGRTYQGDWLCSDAAASRAALEERLRDIAVLPGLSGIALEDTVPPGYQSAGAQADPFADFDSEDYGYTPSMRLAFLRRNGSDPIDLAVRTNRHLSADLSLPFFSDAMFVFHFDEETFLGKQQGGPTLLQNWDTFRFHVNRDMLATLYAFAQSQFPRLPLWVRHTPMADGWWGHWNKPDPFAAAPPTFADDTAEQAARVAARPVLMNFPYAGSFVSDATPTGPQNFAFWVKQRLKTRKPGWDGLVLDLSALPLSQVTGILEGIQAVEKQ